MVHRFVPVLVLKWKLALLLIEEKGLCRFISQSFISIQSDNRGKPTKQKEPVPECVSIHKQYLFTFFISSCISWKKGTKIPEKVQTTDMHIHLFKRK